MQDDYIVPSSMAACTKLGLAMNLINHMAMALKFSLTNYFRVIFFLKLSLNEQGKAYS